MITIRSVCVYCGSSNGSGALYREAGRTLGRCLGENGIRLVYGGGTRGIMGAVAEAVLEAGGSVTGIIPRFLIDKEAPEAAPSPRLELLVTEDMHTRKHTMFDKSDAFVALPGGIGTLEELVEIMTWAQLGRHAKPIVLANVDGFWSPLLELVDHMKARGFLHSLDRLRPIVVDHAEDIVPAIQEAAASAAAAQGDPAVIRRL